MNFSGLLGNIATVAAPIATAYGLKNPNALKNMFSGGGGTLSPENSLTGGAQLPGQGLKLPGVNDGASFKVRPALQSPISGDANSFSTMTPFQRYQMLQGVNGPSGNIGAMNPLAFALMNRR